MKTRLRIASRLLLAAGALALAGQMRLAIAFAIVVVANTTLLFVFGQDARESLSGMGAR